MWKNSLNQTCEQVSEFISLHDCVVNHAEYSDDILSLTFDNGFWMLGGTKYNTAEETVRTDRSEFQYIHFDTEMSSFSISKRHVLFGKHICTTQHEIDIETLIEKINSGAWALEFIDQFHAYHGMMILGVVRMKKKPWWMAFQWNIDCEKTAYGWNQICPDKKW